MSQFSDYNDVVFEAFCLHTKQKDIVDKKFEIISKVTEFYNLDPTNFLFVGFNPAILNIKNAEIFVTEVNDKVFSWLLEQGVNVKKFDTNKLQKFDCVVAVDEYLSFCKTDEEQINNIKALCHFSNNLVITTVKDYKNQDFKDREFSQPAIIKNPGKLVSYIEIHDWDMNDKSSFISYLYEMQEQESKCRIKTNRRALYFKQLAKFSMDSGAADFLVHKNLMYKSLLKKNYEHVISIKFD